MSTSADRCRLTATEKRVDLLHGYEKESILSPKLVRHK